MTAPALVAGLLLAALVAACQLTPDAQAKVDALEAELAAKVEQLDAKAAEADALALQAAESAEALAAAQAQLQAAQQALAAAETPEDREAAQGAVDAAQDAVATATAQDAAALLAAVQELEALLEAQDALKADADALVDEINEVEQADLAGQTGALQPLLPFVPAPAQPFVGIALGLAPWLGRKRSRQHLANMIRNVVPHDGSVSLGEAWDDLLRAFGLSHSSEDPRKLLEVLQAKAKQQDLELVSQGDSLGLAPAKAPAVAQGESAT